MLYPDKDDFIENKKKTNSHAHHTNISPGWESDAQPQV